MTQRSGELAARIARKLRVGVEGDDKFDGRQNQSVADDLGKAALQVVVWVNFAWNSDF
jgi:hypothetical protein